jgi:protein TonB
MSSFALNDMSRPSDSRRQWAALGSALGIEVVLIVLVAGWIATHPSQVRQQIVALTLDAVSQAETMPEAVPLPSVPTRPRPYFQSVLKPAPALPTPTDLPAPTQEPALPILEKATPPPPASEPANAVPPAPPHQATATAADPAPAYNAKLAAAVQAVFQLPLVARDLGFKGRARVQFKLRDGIVSAIELVKGSGLGMVDRAALKAVQVAAYPAPPASLQGKEGQYQIWVECF